MCVRVTNFIVIFTFKFLKFIFYAKKENIPENHKSRYISSILWKVHIKYQENMKKANRLA